MQARQLHYDKGVAERGPGGPKKRTDINIFPLELSRAVAETPFTLRQTQGERHYL